MAKSETTPGDAGDEREYNLGERTSAFGENVIEYALAVHPNPVTAPLISQVVRSGASAGANYCEAEDAVSRKEFKLKIGTCRKEAKETKYWLRMLAKAAPSNKTKARVLWKEANELNLIFSAIWRKL
jgi:four helix bundle protein